MEEKMLTASRVAQRLDVSVSTLTNWYKWYNGDYTKPENVPELPEYTQVGTRGVRYWRESSIPMLIAFKEWIPKGRGGVMGEMNARFWGKRGKNRKQK